MSRDAIPPPPRPLHVLLGQLGPEEREVLADIAERLLLGQRQYGMLDLANDRRDWPKEQGDELTDYLAYVAFAALAKRKRRTP